MDTILASIRRILNEDEVSPAEAAPKLREDAPPAAPDKDDVFMLGEAMMLPPEPPPVPAVPAPAVPAPALPAPEPASVAAASPVPPVAAAPPPAEPPPVSRAAIDGLVAARTRAAAAQSFDALHEAMQQAQTTPSAATSPTILRAGGPTVEDLVRDELRGLLSNWLDVHLPALVETLVRSEIEKLTRRAG